MGAGLVKPGQKHNSLRKRRRVATINVYGPVTSRPRPDRMPRYGELVADHTKHGRCLTMVDAYSDTSFVRPSTPKWQNKWEKTMRPMADQTSSLQVWNSKPLPTIEVTDTTLLGSTMKKQTKPRRARRRKRGKSISANKAERAEVDISDRVEKVSVSSKLVDNCKMLHHTDRRTENYLKYGRQLWNNQPKKANKQWFLGADAVAKQEIEIVPKRRKSIPVFIPILKSTLQKKENIVTPQQSTSRLTSGLL